MAQGLKRKRVLAITAEMMPAATGPVAAGIIVAEKSTPATESTTPPVREEAASSAPVTPPLPPHNAAILKEVCIASGGSNISTVLDSVESVMGGHTVRSPSGDAQSV